MLSKNFKTLLEHDTVLVAERLIGWEFGVVETDGSRTGGIIIETEAYTATDAASHSYRGETSRNSVMFGPKGHLYVYFTYGMHWCANIVTGRGDAVLIRAIQATQGTSRMMERRPRASVQNLVNGPAKLCQALHISGADNGTMIDGKRIYIEEPRSQWQTIATPRIGIRHNVDAPWRFVGTLLD